jgi:hypothetical protein
LLERWLKPVSPKADAVDIGLVATAMTAVATAILICSQLPEAAHCAEGCEATN